MNTVSYFVIWKLFEVLIDKCTVIINAQNYLIMSTYLLKINIMFLIILLELLLDMIRIRTNPLSKNSQNQCQITNVLNYFISIIQTSIQAKKHILRCV